MNLTWHIVKKDLRCFRWPLGFWALLIVAKLGIGVVLLTMRGAGAVEWFIPLDTTSQVLAGLEGASVILVAAMIQEDLLVGTTAFWVTRPISGARLLWAKLLVMVLAFEVLPVLITLPWWLGCHYGWTEIGWAALETVLFHAAFVLVGLLWAVITDGLGRFLMWTLVMLIAIPSIVGGISLYLGHKGIRPPQELVETRLCLAILLGMVATFCVVVHQFLTRCTWRSATLLSAAMALAVAIGLWWPLSWNFDKLREDAVTNRQSLFPEVALSSMPSGLQLIGHNPELFFRKPGVSHPAKALLTVPYEVTGLKETQALMPVSGGTYALQWPDGMADEGVSGGWSGKPWFDLRALKILGLPTEIDARRHFSSANQFIPESVAIRLKNEPARYTAKSIFCLMEVESMVVITPDNAMRTEVGRVSEHIMAMEKDSEELLVTFVRRHPALLKDFFFDRGTYLLGILELAPPWFPDYLLVNRDRKFADRGRAEFTRMVRIGTVGITAVTKAYRGSSLGGGKRPSLKAINALNEAVLTRITFREEARFEHEWKVDRLVVEASGPK